MKEALVIKSYRSGISLLLDDEAAFEEILAQAEEKFALAGEFFRGTPVALSIEGRKLTNDEELTLLQTIRQNSELQVVCLAGRDESVDKMLLRAVKYTNRMLHPLPEGQFLKGSLTNHEVLEAESSIVILGDVNPGCKIISTGNITVLGGLYGEAHAGAAGREECFITALEMEPEKLRIGDFKYEAAHRQRLRDLFVPMEANYSQPKIAYVKSQRIQMEPFA